MTVDTTPLSRHPSDPAIIHPPTTAPGRNAMSRTGRKVAIITGGSQGIGASLVAAYRRQGWRRVELPLNRLGPVAIIRPTTSPTASACGLTVDADRHSLRRRPHRADSRPGKVIDAQAEQPDGEFG